MRQNTAMVLALITAIVIRSIPAAAAPFEDVTSEMGLGVFTSVTFNNHVSWGDYNNDGWPDLYCGNRGASPDGYLFRNEQGQGFTHVPVEGFNLPAIMADFDNDLDNDLYSMYGGGRLLRNDGNGVFTAAESGPIGSFDTHSESALFLDMNGDALLDLYQGAYELLDWGPPITLTYYPDVYTHNTGNGHFSIAGSRPAQPTRGITCADFDEDGDLDIYLSHYRLRPNHLLLNDGIGNFSEVAAAYGAAGHNDSGAYGHTIGSAFADLDNDGHLDLFVGNFAHSDYYQDRSMFLRNMGPGGNWHFEDKSATAGLHYQESYASPAFGDFDNDGDLDLYFTTVYEGDRSVLYRNDGGWQFTDVSTESGLSIQGHYLCAWADFDRDGDLDLFTNGRLYRNPLDNGNHYLLIRVLGDGIHVDRNAIGTQVRIELGGETLTRHVESATGRANQNEFVLHFGLGAEMGLVNAEVRWLNGAVQDYTFAVDQMVTVKGPVAPDQDTDMDSIPDFDEGGNDPDGDNVPNYADLDSDNDGYSDREEALAGTDPCDPAQMPTPNVPVAQPLAGMGALLAAAYAGLRLRKKFAS